MMKDRLPLDRGSLKKVRLYMLVSGLLLVIYFVIWGILYNLYDGIITIILTMLALMPAFLTNATMPLVSHIKGVRRRPIDGGRFHEDGERILGEGKTWNGAIGGVILGFILTVILVRLVYPWLMDMATINYEDGEVVFEYYVHLDQFFGLFDFTDKPVKFFIGEFLLCLSAPVGDGIGSYYKRRKQYKRGQVFLFWDQNDFIIMASFFALFFFPFTWYNVFVALLITPFLTVSANGLGYLLKVKEVPW